MSSLLQRFPCHSKPWTRFALTHRLDQSNKHLKEKEEIGCRASGTRGRLKTELHLNKAYLLMMILHIYGRTVVLTFFFHITSHHITSCHIASHCITPRQVTNTSHHSTSHHITSNHISSHHITSQHNTSHHITSHYILSHRITLHHTTSSHENITSHHVTSHHIKRPQRLYLLITSHFILSSLPRIPGISTCKLSKYKCKKTWHRNLWKWKDMTGDALTNWLVRKKKSVFFQTVQ